jgi:putative transposase
MNCTPEEVFGVLEDGWLFAVWVVGASRIRDVDATWPKADSKIHHSVGSWPLLIDDTTSVVEIDPFRSAGSTGFVLLPRRWVAERTLAWLGRWRRLAREYEELPEVSETMVKLAMIRLMLHRLAHPNRKRLPAP